MNIEFGGSCKLRHKHVHIINQVIYISRIRYFKKKESCFCNIENTYAGFHTVKKKILAFCLDPRAGPGVERIGRTPPPLAQSVETWPIGVRLVCRELRPVSLEERILVIELSAVVDMQHITSALISVRRETMRARVWSVGFVAPSPRDNLCFLFVFFCIFSDTNHVHIHFFVICLSYS